MGGISRWGPPQKRDSRPAGTAAANLENRGNSNRKINNITSADAQHPPAPFSAAPPVRIGDYQLLSWRRERNAMGLRGNAVVRLPSGLVVTFPLYVTSGPAFAEWRGGVPKRHLRAADQARPVAVELVRLHDPDALVGRHGLLPVRSRVAEVA